MTQLRDSWGCPIDDYGNRIPGTWLTKVAETVTPSASGPTGQMQAALMPAEIEFRAQMKAQRERDEAKAPLNNGWVTQAIEASEERTRQDRELSARRVQEHEERKRQRLLDQLAELDAA